jgi:hypothetical protein
MRLPWRREAKSIRPACLVSHKHAELETAKEILGEIFHARPADIDEMIRSRIGERSWIMERTHLAEDELWPATFCLGE